MALNSQNNNAALSPGVIVSLDELIKLRVHATNLDFSSQGKIFSNLSGGYISHFRGRGIDFQEVRIYQPGDDIRSMDWRVTARSGRPHTKLFREERERPVFFVVDNSSSMNFGSRTTFKSVLAAKAAAVLAWAAVKNNDRVGGIIFSDHGYHELRPQGGRRGVLRLIKLITDTQQHSVQNHATQAAQLSTALTHLLQVARTGSRIFLLSDFRTLDEDAYRQLVRLSRHNEIIWVFTFDPLEAQPPASGRYAISDGRRIFSFNTWNPNFCQAYRERFIQRVNELTTTCRKLGIHFLSLATNDDVVRALHSGLTSRAAPMVHSVKKEAV